MSSITKQKPKRSVYLSQYTIKKQIILWVPPTLDLDDIDNKLSLLISNLNFPHVDTSLYGNNFATFYEREISEYDRRIVNATFCVDAITSGVSKGYVISAANDKNAATLLSVNMDQNGVIIDVFALLTFHISQKKLAVRIDTLCGNQVLPPSGEGTRLLKILENASFGVGINKIALDPLPNAMPFYQHQNYRFMEKKVGSKKGDSPVTDSDDDSTPNSSVSSDSSDVSGPRIQMQKNMWARNQWKKIKAYSMLLGQFAKSKKRTELRNQQQTRTLKHNDDLQQMRDELEARRAYDGVPKEGKPINPIGSSFTNQTTFTKMETPKIVIKGNTINLRKEIRHIKREEKQTRKAQKDADVIAKGNRKTRRNHKKI